MRASNPNSSLIFLGGMGWIMGLITGNKSGVSTIPFLVLSLPILASKSFSFISKDNGHALGKYKQTRAYKKCLLRILSTS